MVCVPVRGFGLGLKAFAEQLGQGQLGGRRFGYFPTRLDDGANRVMHVAAGGDDEHVGGVVERQSALVLVNQLPGGADERRGPRRRGGQQQHGWAVRVYALPGAVGGIGQVPGDLLLEQGLRHRRQVHLNERHCRTPVGHRHPGDGVGRQPVPAGPVPASVPFLPPGPVGEPAVEFDALGGTVLAKGEPDLADRGGVGGEHRRRLALSGSGAGDQAGTGGPQPPVPGCGAALPTGPCTGDQVGVV